MHSIRRLTVLAAILTLTLHPGAQPAVAAPPDRGDIGEWTDPVDIGVIGIHATLVRTGEVLLYGYVLDQAGTEAHLYNPVTGGNVDVTYDKRRDIFCSGHSVMPDGRVLIAGGQRYGSPDFDGIPFGTIFDPISRSWSSGGRMANSRWYPTNVQMPDGTTLVLTGYFRSGDVVEEMESFDPATGTWTVLPPSADMYSDLYSKMVLTTDGRVFRAGPQQDTWFFDPATNSWSFVDNMRYGYRAFGGEVLLPGLQRVLVSGGYSSTRATKTAEIIDLSDPQPRWAYTGSMVRPREQHNLVLLADGTVLAVGGGRSGLYDNPVREAELYDPATGTWRAMAAQQAQRTYHSTALLLPDGRVLSAGSDSGDLASTVELYSPPYLFHGPRPVITSAPTEVTYGEEFAIGTNQAADITRVALVRAGSTTHTNNFEQRYVDLEFTVGAGEVSAVAPSTPNEAPPGYYLLFILDSDGVPAVAEFVLLS
jgi:hypothetical protein